MATGQVKIDVSVKDLIVALETKQEETKKEYAQKVAAWRRDVKNSAAELRRVAGRYAKTPLPQMIKIAEDSVEDNPNYRYEKSWGELLDFEGDKTFPKVPRYPTEPECYDNRIKWLKMSATDTIKMSFEQYEAAMRGCW